MASTAADLGASGRPRPDDLVSACLHPVDPAYAGRPALATRAGGGWTELTYRDLDRRSRAVAAWLGGRGVRPGQRVGLLGDGSGDWVAAFFGILRAGAVVVPLDPGLTVDELGRVCEQARPAALALSRRLAGAVVTLGARLGAGLPSLLLEDVASLPEPAGGRVVAARRGDEPAVVVWTAGTTGAPRGVTLSAANIAYVVAAMVHGQRLCRDDRVLSVLPAHHMFELSCGLLAALAAGASGVFAGTLMPHEILRLIRERRITRMAAVPLLLKLLKNDLEARRSGPGQGRLGRHLQALYSGGAPLDPAVVDYFAALGVPVYQGYGLTETAPTVAMNTPAHNRVGSVGRALPGTEIRIDGPAGAAQGEVLVRSPAVMLGYCNDGALTRATVDGHGWLHTGDLGRLDADGFLWLTGRAKNLIVLDSGKKVQPEEVEAALAASPLFAEACVLGLRAADGPRAGAEQVCAVVVPADAAAGGHPGGAALEQAVADEVARLTRGLGGHKRPTVVKVVAGPLPKTAKGTVRHAEVARLAQQRERVG